MKEWTEMEGAGLSGMLVLLVAFGLVMAGVAFAVIRVPRSLAILLVLASGFPILVGAAAMAISRAETAEVIATLRAPTPRDFAGGEYEALFHLAIGLAGTLVAFAAALPALARSRLGVPAAAEA